jgi:hypothetical protein
METVETRVREEAGCQTGGNNRKTCDHWRPEGQGTKEQEGRSRGCAQMNKCILLIILVWRAHNNDVGQGELASCTMPQ